jgi:hypothetical protein
MFVWKYHYRALAYGGAVGYLSCKGTNQEVAAVKYTIMLMAVCSLAFATDQDGADIPGQETVIPEGSDDITIDVLNTWQAPYASHILGLEYKSTDNTLLFVSSLNNKIFIANPDNGTQIGSIDRPAGMVGFDVAWDGTEYYINGWGSTTVIYHGTGSGWTSYANPSGANGRGLCFDGADMWESNQLTCYTFETNGTGATAYTLPGIPGQISGLTTFPIPIGTDQACGIMATCYNTAVFYFYAFNGSTITPLGSIACPLSVSNSYGLAYAGPRGTFFWGYLAGGQYYVSELDIDLGMALSRDTWGAIKTEF